MINDIDYLIKYIEEKEEGFSNNIELVTIRKKAQEELENNKEISKYYMGKFHYLIAITYFNEKLNNEAFKYFNSSLKYINDSSNEDMLGNIYSYISMCYNILGNSYKSRKYFLLAEKIFKKEGNVESLLKLYLNTMIKEAISTSNYFYINKYLSKSEELIQNSVSPRHYTNLGQIYLLLNDIDNAVKTLNKGIDYSEIYNKYYLKTVCSYALANCYLKKNGVQEAKRIFENLVDVDNRYLTPTYKGIIYIELMDIYLDNNENIYKIEEMIEVVNSIIESSSKFVYDQFLAKIILIRCKYNIIKNNNLKESLKLISKAENIYKKYQGNFRFTNFSYDIESLYGEIYFKIGNNNLAIKHYYNSLKCANICGAKYVVESYINISKVLKELGNFEEAYKNSKRANYILKNINNEALAPKYKLNNHREELNSYEEIKNKLFENLSYNLRTPIVDIYESIKLINSKIDVSAEELKESFFNYEKEIGKNCFRTLKLIDDIIDSTRLDSNEFDISFGNYNVIDIIETVTLKAVSYAKEREQKITFDTEVEELEIKCDPRVIVRSMLNLLSNAIKSAGYKGNILVKISIIKKYIEISVKDDGKHLKKGFKKDIFHNDLCNNFEMGLAITRQLLRLHNGRVYCKNSLKIGNEFIILLPNVKLKDGKCNPYVISDVNIAKELSI